MLRTGPSKSVGVRVVLLCAAIVLAIGLALARKPWEVQPPSGRISVEYCVAISSWWAGAINAVGLVVLALTASLWMKPIPLPAPTPLPPPPRWFYVTVLAAIIAAAAFNIPRLGAGFWDDEEYSVRRSISGTYNSDLKFRDVRWRDTFFYYAKPTNHILNSLTARLSNSLWRSLARPDGLPYSEPAVRLPAFLAGLASIGVVALLMWQMGFVRAGALAAWLLAVHPWFLRYAAEARGYAFVFLLLPLACLVALKAVRHGTAGWWILYGLCQFLLLVAWVGSAEFLLLLNLGVLGMIVFRGSGQRALLPRFLLAGFSAAMLTLQLYAPCVPQFLKYSEKIGFTTVDLSWCINVASRFLTGLPWTLGPDHASAFTRFQAFPWFSWGCVVLVVLAIGFGLARILLRGGDSAWLLPVMVLSVPLFVFSAWLKGIYIFEWYVVGILPLTVILVAAGLTWPLVPLARNHTPFACGIAAIFPVLALLFNFPSYQLLQGRPVSPIRESVLLTRPSLNPHDPANRNILTAAFLGTPEIYDPACVKLHSADNLKDIMAQARTSGRALWINQSYSNTLKSADPEAWRLLFNPEIFRHTPLPGIEPMFDRDVFEFHPPQYPRSRGPGVPQ